MISYRLKCESGHEFDSWFNTAADFDRLKSAHLLECTICGSSSVEKSLMSPSTTTKRQNKEPHPLETLKKKVKEDLKDAKNVGWQFAKTARDMHKGEREPEPIYGKAEPEDAIELLREGVNIAPLPFDPDAKEN